MTTPATTDLTRNRLLAALPPDERDRLARNAQLIHPTQHDIFYKPGQPISHVHFPLSGMYSLLTQGDPDTTRDAVEVGTVGNEGFVGLPVLLEADTAPGTAMCQIPGPALAVPAGDLRAAVAAEGNTLRRLLFRYTQALFDLVAQSAMCGRMHTVEERCARWLLMSHDRAGSDQFPLTHEFLSQMLGVRRAGVTVAAGALQTAGLISYTRGHITIRNRPALEDASCECYRIVKQDFDRLLGPTTTHREQQTQEPP